MLSANAVVASMDALQTLGENPCVNERSRKSSIAPDVNRRGFENVL